MAKNFSCPCCGVAMVFNPQTQELYCEYCNSSYTVQQITEPKDDLKELLRKLNEKDDSGEGEAKEPGTISMKIVRCSSCGAELALHDGETSTYCAYCGQPTIATERLQDCRRPDFIIPFKVSRERAEHLIREQITGGTFIPKEIRDFEPERICGIYIPYWIFDVYASDMQFWKYSDDDSVYYTFHAADSVFHRVTSEASRRFNDYFSEKLEPYRMEYAVRFDETYLSGFYSDRFDVDSSIAGHKVLERTERMFLEKFTEMRKARYETKVSSNPRTEIIRARYALLPVWFMTMRYRNKPYTVLVNGQTGKTVCSMPVNKMKAYGLFASVMVGLSALLLLLFTFINNKIFNNGLDKQGQTFIFYMVYVPVAIIAVGLLLSGIPAIRRLFRIRSGVRVASSESNEHLLKGRQG